MIFQIKTYEMKIEDEKGNTDSANVTDYCIFGIPILRITKI